jgi:hypothetical protein
MGGSASFRWGETATGSHGIRAGSGMARSREGYDDAPHGK